MKDTQHRPDRLRLHGPHALQRLPQVDHFFDAAVPAGAQGGLRAQRATRREAFAETGATSPSRPTGGTLVERDDIDVIDIASPNDMHARDRHRRGQGRQDGPLREAAGRERRRGARDGRRRREGRRAEHGLVQLPPRAGRDAGQAAHRRGPARPHLPLPRQVPPGLDDLAGPAAGRRRALAARRQASPAAASPATCWPTASTPRCGSTAPIDERHAP